MRTVADLGEGPKVHAPLIWVKKATTNIIWKTVLSMRADWLKIVLLYNSMETQN